MEQEQFVDAESFGGGKQDITFQQIVFRHLVKVIDLGSKEWRGGYFSKKYKSVSGAGFMEETYVEDTREAFGNAVDRFSDLLFPHFDKDMKEAEEKIRKTLKEEGKDKKTKAELHTLKVSHKKTLFRELNDFLKRKRYFESIRGSQ